MTSIHAELADRAMLQFIKRITVMNTAVDVLTALRGRYVVDKLWKVLLFCLLHSFY